MAQKPEVYFFNDKGDYANTDGMVAIDTTYWMDEHWDRIICAQPLDRKLVAILIDTEFKNRKSRRGKNNVRNKN